MLNKNEEIIESCNYVISQGQLRFDYPFEKVDMMLFKKAVEDFFLVNPSKVKIPEDDC